MASLSSVYAQIVKMFSCQLKHFFLHLNLSFYISSVRAYGNTDLDTETIQSVLYSISLMPEHAIHCCAGKKGSLY